MKLTPKEIIILTNLIDNKLEEIGTLTEDEESDLINLADKLENNK